MLSCSVKLQPLTFVPTLSHLRGWSSQSPLGNHHAGKIDVFLKVTTGAAIAQSFIEYWLCSKHVSVLCTHMLISHNPPLPRVSEEEVAELPGDDITCLVSPVHMQSVAVAGPKPGQPPLVWPNFPG